MMKTEQKAREILANATLADLLDEWELTSNVNTSEIYIVRGWLMDEIESRKPEAFAEWLESEDFEDTTLREYMTK